LKVNNLWQIEKLGQILENCWFYRAKKQFLQTSAAKKQGRNPAVISSSMVRRLSSGAAAKFGLIKADLIISQAGSRFLK